MLIDITEDIERESAIAISQTASQQSPGRHLVVIKGDTESSEGCLRPTV